MVMNIDNSLGIDKWGKVKKGKVGKFGKKTCFLFVCEEIVLFWGESRR